MAEVGRYLTSLEEMMVSYVTGPAGGTPRDSLSQNLSEGANFLVYVGTDAARWAQEFCKVVRDFGVQLDEGWMIGWFANAIEAGYDAGQRNAKNPPLPMP